MNIQSQTTSFLNQCIGPIYDDLACDEDATFIA